MFKKMKLGTKIFSGFTILLFLMMLIGGVGYFSLQSVGDALFQISSEETPLVMAASGMELNMMTARNTLEELKGVTSTMSTAKADEVVGLESAYRDLIKKFDLFADAILVGGELSDGTAVIKTDNPKLARLVEQSDQIHNEEFQVAAEKMISEGKSLLSKSAESKRAMKSMEVEFDAAMEVSVRLEAAISDEIKQLASRAKGRKFLAIIREEFPLADMANEMRTALAETRISLEEVAQFVDLNEVEEVVGHYEEDIKKFDTYLNAILKGGNIDGVVVIATDNPLVRKLALEMDEKHEAFQEAGNQVIETQRTSIAQMVLTEEAMADLDKAGDRAAKLIYQVKMLAVGEMSAAQQTGESTRAFSQILLIVFVVAGVLLGAILAGWLTRIIAQPIRIVVEGITSASGQVGAASEQIAQSSQSLAESNSQQAASLEETASTLEEMSGMTRQNAQNAHEAGSLVQKTIDLTKGGKGSMDRMETAINDIKESSNQTAKIVKSIDEIAFQTNLLALNAAVEAARAGDVGKGFAVVADEVRNLAQRAAESAKDTSALIETSQERADLGVRIAGEVAEALSEILESTQTINTLVQEVAASSEEQSNGIEQLNSAVAQMDTATQSNSATSEENASTSEELSAQALELNSMVSELMAMVGRGKSTEGNGKSLSPHEDQGTFLVHDGPGTLMIDHMALPANAPEISLKEKVKKDGKPTKDLTPEHISNLSDDDFAQI